MVANSFNFDLFNEVAFVYRHLREEDSLGRTGPSAEMGVFGFFSCAKLNLGGVDDLGGGTPSI